MILSSFVSHYIKSMTFNVLTWVFGWIPQYDFIFEASLISRFIKHVGTSRIKSYLVLLYFNKSRISKKIQFHYLSSPNQHLIYSISTENFSNGAMTRWNIKKHNPEKKLPLVFEKAKSLF